MAQFQYLDPFGEWIDESSTTAQFLDPFGNFLNDDSGAASGGGGSGGAIPIMIIMLDD